MTRRRLVLLFVAAVALLGAATASATTGPTDFVTLKLELTDSGVKFVQAPPIQAGMIALFRITNHSKSARWFYAAGRQTPLLKPKAHDVFYVQFASTGSYAWKSRAKHGHTFTGVVHVVPCPPSAVSCNNTAP